MGHAEAEAFLTHLAAGRQVSVLPNIQVLSALLFLYQDVLNLDTADINAVRVISVVPTVLIQEAIAFQLCHVSTDNQIDERR